QAAWIVQQSARDVHLATEIAASAADDALQPIAIDLVARLFNRNEFLVEPELHQRLGGLSVRPFRQLFAGNAVGKARYVHDALVGIEKFWLTARLALGFDNKGREGAVRRREGRGQPGRAGADDHHIPAGQRLEIKTRFKRLDVEVGHGRSSLASRKE